MGKLGDTIKVQKALGAVFMNHQKLPGFISDVRGKGICEGTEIAIAVRYPDGTEYKTGLRVKQSDIDALADLKGMSPTE